MTNSANDLRVAVAVYATALVTVMAGFARDIADKGFGPADIGALPVLLIMAAPLAFLGGSLAVPFAILALRGTRISRTIPMVAVPTVAASLIAGIPWSPFHAAAASLAACYAALLCVRFLMPRHQAPPCEGPDSPNTD